MTKTALLLCPLLFWFIALGCTEPTDYGQSYQKWFAAQVLHPNAPQNPSPAMLLSGELAEKIKQNRYIPTMTEKIKEKETVTKKAKLDSGD